MSNAISKIMTGIEGFDFISSGGLPENRSTLVSGTPGSAKTIFAVQFLLEGITKLDHNGVFVTFEETPEDIRRNIISLGWDIGQFEKEGKFAFVDASPEPGQEFEITGNYDLGALLARIENAVKKIDAKRVSIDSLGAIFSQVTDHLIVRKELFKLTTILKRMGATSILTAERTTTYGDIARFGIEEFITDNVVILRNALHDEKRLRTVEILKLRGANHLKGEFRFTITPDRGIVIIPLSSMELAQQSTDMRVASGNTELDKMCGGGFFRNSVILCSGATGTGKTLMVTEFMNGGTDNNERRLLFTYEESEEQLFRNATGWGVDYKTMVENGNMKIVFSYPETKSLEDHLIEMKSLINEYKPDRVALDSLSSLERVSTEKGFREFLIALTSFIKFKELTSLFTSTTTSLMGGSSGTEGHISTITDSIILMRYVELYGEMHRGLTVLKMRGSQHDKSIRRYEIDGSGMHIKEPFRNVSGILTGKFTYLTSSELERMSEVFKQSETVSMNI